MKRLSFFSVVRVKIDPETFKLQGLGSTCLRIFVNLYTPFQPKPVRDFWDVWTCDKFSLLSIFFSKKLFMFFLKEIQSLLKI